MSVSIAEAQAMVRSGAYYGDVVQLVDSQYAEEFKHWWLHTPGVPNLTVRGVHAMCQCEADVSLLCGRCGNTMRNSSGGCWTCPVCAHSEGCGG